jgi:lipopolysaccharide transport system permease protein
MLQPPTITIKATKGFGSLGLAELWEYRDLLRFHILREVKGKYRQMALGPLWIVLQPVINMIVLSFVFGKVAKLPSDGIPYPIFTYTALIPWTFFSNATTFSSGCLITDMQIISKVYFPRLVIPIASVAARLIDFAICLVILVVMMAYFGYWPSLRWLMIPIYLFLTIAFALALGLWSASLAVRFRDVVLVVRYGVQVFMYLTPVAYAASNFPDAYQPWLQLNPMYWVVEGFRWSLLGKGMGPEPYMWIPVGITLVLLVSGAFVFRRTERTIVDLL